MILPLSTPFERRVGLKGHAVLVAQPEQPVADAAIEHAEFFLDQVELASLDVLEELRVAQVGRANRADLALLGAAQKAHRIGDRAGELRQFLPVHDVDVDVVGLQALQARLDFLGNAFRAELRTMRTPSRSIIKAPSLPSQRKPHFATTHSRRAGRPVPCRRPPRCARARTPAQCRAG